MFFEDTADNNNQGWHGTGAQIDLIIDRADKCINLCEIKFWENEFMISNDYAKTLFTTLITIYGAQKDKNYLSSVDVQLEIDTLFA